MPTAAPAPKADPAASAVPAYGELLRLARETAVLGSVGALLSWDQETMMPPKGAELRSDQLSLISALTHEKATSARFGDLLEQCESSAALKGDADAQANLREFRREYDRRRRLPTPLVAEFAKVTSQAMDAWKDARQRSDFNAFAPWLERVVNLNRDKARCYLDDQNAGGDALYDALMEDFEPGMTAEKVKSLFGPLRDALTPFIADLVQSGRAPDDAIHHVKVPRAKQVEFNRFIATELGYDPSVGRLDVSTHPFSESVGPGDQRMTTRYQDDRAFEAVLTTMHETGHSLYEMGLPKHERFGQPLATYISLGIHESQSRMWENFVGRSRAFWAWAFPKADAMFGGAYSKFTAEDAFRSVNIVKPHFIRVESDECTYNLHIMLRFDIERALIAGDLAVKDVPRVWNERVKNDLGLTVSEDRIGCLQDVHWSMGAIGYFPTYTLGNLYCAQFFETIRRDIPNLDATFEQGDFAPLLGWTREKIHSQGRRYSAPELCERITGKPLSHEPLVRYLKGKLRAVYGV